MTNRDQTQNRSAVDLSAVVPWVNDSGEEIPAYGVIQLRTDYDTTSHATKPNGTDGLFLVNGPVPVASTKDGESLVWNRPRVVLLDASASVGDEVGPVDGSWSMTPDGTGFRVLKQAESGKGVVVQVGGGGGASLWGIVTERIGCGVYTIELGTLGEEPSGSGSGTSCDPCVGVTGAGTSACELVLEYPTSRVVGSGVFVTAYDPSSTLIPLRNGTDCVVTKMPGSSAPASGSGASTSMWSVRGFQEHIVEYRQRAECCPDGSYKVVGKTPIVLIGKVCEEILCEECPASGSG